MQTLEDVLHWERSLFEELLQERIVAFGNHFDQRFVSLLGGLSEVVWNGDFLALPVAIYGVGVALHADEIHYTFELFFGADGKLDGDCEAAENILHAREGAVEGRTLAVEFVDENGAGKI